MARATGMSVGRVGARRSTRTPRHPHRRRALIAGAVLGVSTLVAGGTYGAAVRAGWHVDEGGIVGWTGFYLHVGRDCPPPYCTPDNPGEFDPLILTCRLTREPLGAARPHLDWPRCTLRRP